MSLRSIFKKRTTALDRRKMKSLLALLNDQSQPNMNAVVEITRNIRLIELNIKAFGYDLARRMAEALPTDRETSATIVNLKSKPSTQTDIESPWLAHWMGQLKVPVLYHRKIWELAYVLQAIYEHGHLRPGARALGFGCGVEPVPSYLASQDVSVTVTDLEPESARKKGWISTNQHTRSLEQAFHPQLCDRALFDARVQLRIADMNAIPADLLGYDFCWSMCALEHLGSIRQGLDFVEASLATLRPGGLSVHTMEFNIEAEGPTIDNWLTVLFQRKHLEALAARLRNAGHHVAELDFDFGDKPLDRFIDLPPYEGDLSHNLNNVIGDSRHLKLGIDGFVSTCFGIIVRKAN